MGYLIKEKLMTSFVSFPYRDIFFWQKVFVGEAVVSQFILCPYPETSVKVNIVYAGRMPSQLFACIANIAKYHAEIY